MYVRDVVKECHALGHTTVDIWVQGWGGSSMAIGKWYVGKRTLYRLYDGSFEADPFTPEQATNMISWSQWWEESNAVNGYHHSRAITSYHAPAQSN